MNPVIVLGMHRSGTSLVSRMLQRLGVFMGADLQDDGESLTLITLAETVFAAAGATWDRPLVVAEHLADPEPARLEAMVAEGRPQPPFAFTAHPQLRTFARLCLDEGTELFGYREEIERALAEA